MMFEKPYYSLAESAKKLKITVNDLLHIGASGKVYLSIRYLPPFDEERFFVAKKYDDNYLFGYSEYEHSNEYLFRFCGYALDGSTIAFIANTGKAYITSKESGNYLLNSNVIVLPDFNDLDENLRLCLVSYHDINNDKKDYGSKSYITKDDLIVSASELNRLILLKAEHDNKPTYEQLQKKLDQYEQKIKELEEKASNPKKESSVKGKSIHTRSKETIRQTFIAIKQLYPYIKAEAIKKQTELNGKPVGRSTINNYLNGEL